MDGAFRLEIAAFPEGGAIPPRYTGDAGNASPALRWSAVPPDAQELALLVDDPDAPRATPFVHWIAFDIPPSAAGIPDAVPHTARVNAPIAFSQGKNDFGQIGYGGPAPPRGHGVHHYHFRLYALDTRTNLSPGCDIHAFKRAIHDHVLAEADYVGTYER